MDLTGGGCLHMRFTADVLRAKVNVTLFITNIKLSYCCSYFSFMFRLAEYTAFFVSDEDYLLPILCHGNTATKVVLKKM
jgi:hypothetical protein